MPAQFLLYQSNSLSALAEQFAATLNRPRANPLRPESVIIQTTGMETWLTQHCAKQNDIFAAIEYIRPAKYLLRLNALLTGQSEERTVFESENMRWFIYREIEENPHRYPIVEEYLAGGDGELRQQKLFTFASEAAEMIDSYILYRPDMLEAWERDEFAADAMGNELFTGQTRKHEEWQKRLWQAMIRFHRESENPGQNPVEVLTNLGKILAEPTPPERLVTWSRSITAVALFGMSVLPPRYMELFKLLSQHVQVELYVINPSAFYWGDTLTDRHVSFRQKKQPHGDPEAEYLYMGNRLLRNLGEAGRDFYHSLYETAEHVNIHEHELFREPETTSLLHEIQRDILTWNDNDREEPLVLPADNSLTINRCYTPLREVEVLYDYLLDRFEKDPSLSLGDILIITPDIETYAPLITMIFSKDSILKGSVADRSAIAENTVLQLIKEIVSLPESRFTAPEIMSLFQQYARFTEGELSLREEEKIQKWVSESGIRWGTDGDFWQKRTGSSFGNDRFSWRSGLDRMFQGYAGGDSEFATPSYAEIEGSDGELLGRLAAFIRSVSKLEELSRRTFTIDQWSDRLTGWFRELFLFDEGEHEDVGGRIPVLSDIIQYIRKITEQVAVTKDKDQELQVSFGTIRSALVRLLEDEESGAGFLRGTITFASTMPLRSIPFRVVGCIGMNHNTFPRIGNARSFDLMKANRRRGDRDTRHNDLYLFLETLISAGETLYISATAFDEKSGEAQPVSSVVDQLESYIEDNYLFIEHPPASRSGTSEQNINEEKSPSGGFKGRPLDVICTTHPLHPFSRSYLQDNRLFTYQKQWFPQEQPKELFTDSLFDRRFELTIDTVTFPMLLNYLENPLKDLFETLCSMTFPDEQEAVDDEEPFTMDALREHLLRDAGVQEWITESALVHDTERELYFKGDLPAGASLESAKIEITRAVENFKERIPGSIIGTEPEEVSFQNEIDGTVVDLTTAPLFPNGDEMVLVDAGNIKSSSGFRLKRLFRFYLSHLICNASEPTTVKMITRDATMWFPAMEQAAAQESLNSLIRIYIESRSRFLPYFGQASQVQYKKKVNVAGILEDLVQEGFMKRVDFHEQLFMEHHVDRFTPEIEEKAMALTATIFQFIDTIQSGK